MFAEHRHPLSECPRLQCLENCSYLQATPCLPHPTPVPTPTVSHLWESIRWGGVCVLTQELFSLLAQPTQKSPAGPFPASWGPVPQRQQSL